MEYGAKIGWIGLTLLVLQSFVGSATSCAQSPQFPYQGLVVSDGAKVFSGPGDMHYATETLSQGDVVEVHRHDPGGWCAIRPPQGSFSLVPESTIRVIDDTYGEVVEANAQAWVGTALGAVDKPLWQVKLKDGERVKLLGEISWPDPEGHSTVWYQIAPPNGEFRWIHLDDLQVPVSELPEEFETQSHQNSHRPQPTPMTGSMELKQASNEGWRPAKAPFSEENTKSDIQLVSGEQSIKPEHQQIYQASPVGVFEEEPNENGFVTPKIGVRRPTESSADVGPVNFEQAESSLPQRSTRPERYASADAAFGGAPSLGSMNVIQPLGNVRLTPRLQNIDLRLSHEVIKPTAQWRLRELAFDVQNVINQASDASESTAAQRLLDKIKNFQRVQENARVTNVARAPDGTPLSTAAVGSGLRSETSPGSIYDAQGWLNELVLKRGTVESTYVLQDDQGKITHHVQPAPGLNLHRYLRSKIGIVGQRGFHRQLNLDHVLAERLIVLEKPRQ